MGNTGILEQGQKIEAIFGPLYGGGEQSGGAIGLNGVTEIKIGRCAGPMGWYDVAIIKRENQPDEIIPIHMAEYVRLMKPK